MGRGEQHHGRDGRDRRREPRWYVGVRGDDRVQRVRGHRHRGPTDQQRPRIPGRPLARERDHRDRRNDDHAIDDQRPRPRLALSDARSAGEVSQRGEGQPERAGRDEHGPDD